MTLSRKATTIESVYSNDKRPPRWPVRGNEEAGKFAHARARKTIVPCAPKWEDVSPTSTLPRELDSCLIGLKTFYAAATNLRLTIGIKNVGTDNGSMDAQMQLGVCLPVFSFSFLVDGLFRPSRRKRKGCGASCLSHGKRGRRIKTLIVRFCFLLFFFILTDRWSLWCRVVFSKPVGACMLGRRSNSRNTNNVSFDRSSDQPSPCLVQSFFSLSLSLSLSFSLSLSLSLSRFLYFFSFSLSLFLSFSLSLCLHFLFDVAIRHPFVGLHPKQMLFSKVCLCLKISFRNTRPKNIVLEHASERDVVLKKNVSETNVSETNVVFGFLILYSPTLRFSMLNRTPVRARIPPMFDFFFALFLSHSFSLSHTRTLFDSIHYESNRETSLSCSI